MLKKKSIKILMAEDDEEDQMFVRDAWDDCRILNQLDIVANGEELLRYLRNEGAYADREKFSKPGIILLDLNMPKMDGRKALEIIKSDPELNWIPVIILTTSKAEEDILRSYGLGANSFITKPVTYDSLMEVIGMIAKYWLEIVELQAEG